MAKTTNVRILTDGVSLPFIKKRPTRRGLKFTECESSTSEPCTSSSPSLERPSLCLRQLSGRPTLDWPIRLPAKDPRGVAMGCGFESWKKAREGRTGISGNWYSIKTGRMQACHSLLEARLHTYFDMCPFVLECRTQYPSWSREEYERYYFAAKPFPKTKVMTIDFMLTLSIPGVPHLVYHGVSAKPKARISEVKTIARHEREASAIRSWGGTHEVMDEFTISDAEYKNYLILKSWFLWTDIESRMAAALDIALAVKRTRSQGPLDRVLPMIGRRLGFSRDESYRLFGIAVFLGYLWLDHRFPLRVTEPLVLLP